MAISTAAVAEAVTAATEATATAHDDHEQTRGTISITTLRNAAVAVVAASVLVALVLVGLGRYNAINKADGREADQQHAILAARTEVLALTTVSAKSSQVDINRLLAGATPAFREQFQQQAKDFKTALEAADVTSTGSIASAGIESIKGNTAVVLVAATGTVKNKNTTKAEPRNYRLRVTLQKSGSTWLVSGMDFVA